MMENDPPIVELRWTQKNTTTTTTTTLIETQKDAEKTPQQKFQRKYNKLVNKAQTVEVRTKINNDDQQNIIQV